MCPREPAAVPLYDPPLEITRAGKFLQQTGVKGPLIVGGGAATGTTAGVNTLIYSNTLGPIVFSPRTANSPIADDIITTAVQDSSLDRFRFRVSGNSDGLGVGPRGAHHGCNVRVAHADKALDVKLRHEPRADEADAQPPVVRHAV